MTKQQRTRKRPANSKQSNKRAFQLSKFARSLLSEWRKLGLPFTNANVIVAVSGGADSMALLCALDELIQAKKLKIKIVVAHLNHKLRGKASDADARWVDAVAGKLGHPVIIAAIDVKQRAAKLGDNLEQAARRERYQFFKKCAQGRKANLVLTAHTMDDQAETILMNLLRGSGADGLTGIDPARPLEAGSKVFLARPLLSWARRSDTETHCRERSIDFRVDEMNSDESLVRVRVRRQLVPLMKSFNPRFVESLARTMEIVREDSLALDAAAARLLDLSFDQKDSLRADLLRLAQPALRRRALRLWLAQLRGDLRRLEHAHITAIERLLASPASGRMIELPGGSKVSRKGGLLRFHGKKSNAA